MIHLAPWLALPPEAVTESCLTCSWARWVGNPYTSGHCAAPISAKTAADHKKMRYVIHRENPFCGCPSWDNKQRASLAGGVT